MKRRRRFRRIRRDFEDNDDIPLEEDDLDDEEDDLDDLAIIHDVNEKS